MNKIFEYQDYKRFIWDRINAMPHKGHGEMGRIARALRVHPSLVSQILRGSKDLNLEQTCELCSYWGLNDLEAEYLQKLVLLARTGTEKLRRSLKAQLAKLNREANQLSARLQVQSPLSESEIAVFYSGWLYSGARLASSLPGLNSADAIADYLEVPVSRVAKVLDFLVANGLCVEQAGKIQMGPQNTHIPSSSPLVNRHHGNWRLKGLESMERTDPAVDLFFTAPVSLSRKDQVEIRKKLLGIIEDLISQIRQSPSEKLACLNIDWFSIR